MKTEVISYVAGALVSACAILVIHSTLMEQGATSQMS